MYDNLCQPNKILKQITMTKSIYMQTEIDKKNPAES